MLGRKKKKRKTEQSGYSVVYVRRSDNVCVTPSEEALNCVLFFFFFFPSSNRKRMTKQRKKQGLVGERTACVHWTH